MRTKTQLNFLSLDPQSLTWCPGQCIIWRYSSARAIDVSVLIFVWIVRPLGSETTQAAF